MKWKAIMAALVLGLLQGQDVSAQKFSLSTDILGYAKLGTMNIDASFAVSRRWSLTAGARYNPFTFRKGDDGQFQYRQLSYYLGT